MNRYQPFFCEENAWHLCSTGDLVIIVSNAARAVPLWYQRVAPAPGHPVVWDYHVVVARRVEAAWHILDLDTLLGEAVPFERYLRRTFAEGEQVRALLAPRFRVVDAEIYRARLSSDRGHMLNDDGQWQAPPPAWPRIGRGVSNLMSFIDMETPFVGTVMDLAGLHRLLTDASP